MKEQRVYSVLEIAEKCLKIDGRGGEPSAFEVALVSEGYKNGSLAERQRPEQVELREAVKELKEMCIRDHNDRMKLLKFLFKIYLSRL